MDPEPDPETWRPIRRDYLAADRTTMANERTLLAYTRTFLTLTIAGASFLALTDHPVLVTIGWIFIPVAILIIVTGVIRFFQMRRAIARQMTSQIPRDGGDG